MSYICPQVLNGKCIHTVPDENICRHSVPHKFFTGCRIVLGSCPACKPVKPFLTKEDMEI
jgi:hypothetical protein